LYSTFYIELFYLHHMFSLRVLGGSLRRLRDFILAAVELPIFAPPQAGA
jgi:hypothetical protein